MRHIFGGRVNSRINLQPPRSLCLFSYRLKAREEERPSLIQYLIPILNDRRRRRRVLRTVFSEQSLDDDVYISVYAHGNPPAGL